MHPFPAEHDQQQAHALDILKEAKSFILIHFPEGEKCEHPFCEETHLHSTTRVIASCSRQDFHNAMGAIAEELMIVTAIDTLMGLDPAHREQIAGILRGDEGAFFRLGDDED